MTHRSGQPGGSPIGIVLIVVAAGLLYFLVMSPSGQLGGGRGGLAVGETLPPLTAEGWINGEPPDLAGKVVVVDAWATWCGPCRQAAPKLLETYQKFADRDDLVFIGLTDETGEAVARVEQFLNQVGIPWSNGYGADAAQQALKVRYLPSMWVIDRSGKVVWNYDSPGELEQAITKALKQ